MDRAREWIGLALQLVGVVAVVIGLSLWLGIEAAWIAGGIALLVIGTLVELFTGEVTADEQGTGETG